MYKYFTKQKEKNCIICGSLFLGRVIRDKCFSCKPAREKKSNIKPLETKNCIKCDTPFYGRVAKKKCQSCDLKRVFIQHEQPEPCLWCGKLFSSVRKNAKLCSRSCSSYWVNNSGLGPKHDNNKLWNRFIEIIRREDRIMSVQELCILAGVTHKVFSSRKWNLENLYGEAGVYYGKRMSSIFEEHGYASLLELGLTESDLEFEKTFDGLLGPGMAKLRFDFFIPKYNLLIELDGNQHKYKGHWHRSSESFLALQHRDLLKDNFAEEKEITLIRIPYRKTKEEVFHLLKNAIAPYIGDNL